MLYALKSSERGQANHGWLNSFHTFSFADYHNPALMGFRVLRVINEDYIAGGRGFSTHGHSDMEIITYVVSGALKHQDTLGNSTVILPGDVQRMSAGSGIRHSEHNHLPDQETHLLQIWILPKSKGIEPSYEQKSFTKELANQKITLVVSENGEKGSIRIHQDVNLYVGRLKSGEHLDFSLPIDRHLWIQVVKGKVKTEDLDLQAGDGAVVQGQTHVAFHNSNQSSTQASELAETSEFLIFDLP